MKLTTSILLVLSIFSFTYASENELTDKEEKALHNILKKRIEMEVSTGNPNLYYLTNMNEYNYFSAEDLYEIYEDNALKGDQLTTSNTKIILSGEIDSITPLKNPIKTKDLNEKIAVISLKTSKSIYDNNQPLQAIMTSPKFYEKALDLKKGDYISSIICFGKNTEYQPSFKVITFPWCWDIDMYSDIEATRLTLSIKTTLKNHLSNYSEFENIDQINSAKKYTNKTFSKNISYLTAKFLFLLKENKNLDDLENNFFNSFNRDSQEFKDFSKSLNLPNNSDYI